MSEPPSSPPSGDASVEDMLSWYKTQYEQLEHELAEFRDSSRELEAELEKDLDAADKREQTLRERAEALDFEVEEWKRKYKESKAEANAAQNTLEKEITKLRDANRTLQLKLRDIEVANDDFERQARNTTSSLEDLESKYNVSIERGVMLEEEIKIGEQERETLRVDSQRLREELSDLKIEAEILQDKLKKQEAKHLSTISTDISVPESPTFDRSPNSTASSPLVTTPPDSKSVSTPSDPPSPKFTMAKSTPLPKPALVRTPAPASRRSRLPSTGNSITPRPKANFSASVSSSAVRPLGSRVATASAATRTPAARTSTFGTASAARSGARSTSHKVPSSSTSLTHIRSLTAQMQRLEARVQSARSKLPAPAATPPRASPRASITGAPGSAVPSSVTMRSRKRTTGSTASSIASSGVTAESYDSTPTPSNAPRFNPRGSVTGGRPPSKHVPRLSTSGVSRLSFGPLPNRALNVAGSGSGFDSESSRPSSRASVSSFARPSSRAADTRDMPPPRPMSRTSMSGARTPLGRPRSSMGMHGHSLSISGSMPEDGVDRNEYRSPSRRGVYSRLDADITEDSGSGSSGVPGLSSGIPMPGSSSRRQSSGIPAPSLGRRLSTNWK